jgi:hypothetical protein
MEWGIGNKKDDKAFATASVGTTQVELVFGEHPHSRQDHNIYARYPDGRIENFDGHRILTRIEIGETNYLKESELSGDEIRKGGYGKIFFDGIQCYEFFHRDAEWACLRAKQLVAELKEHSSGWANKKNRDKLVGRKVFWERTPAIIKSLIVDQGCVILEPESGMFPSPIHDSEREPVKWISH